MRRRAVLLLRFWPASDVATIRPLRAPMLERAICRPGQPVEKFAQAFRGVCEPLFARGEDHSFARLMARLLTITNRFELEVQAHLLLAQKTMFQAEGLGRLIDTELNVWQSLTPLAVAYLAERRAPGLLLREKKRDLQDRLADLARHASQLDRYLEEKWRASQGPSAWELARGGERARFFRPAQLSPGPGRGRSSAFVFLKRLSWFFLGVVAGWPRRGFMVGPTRLTDIEAAVRCLRQGRVVAFPTETVYGLGADAHAEEAVRSIYRLKNRPLSNPVLLHVHSGAMAHAYGHLSGLAERLMHHFWPGPLTLLVPCPRHGFCPCVWRGGSKLRFGVPFIPGLGLFLEQFGRAIAAPSANKSGCLSPTTARHVEQAFQGESLSILDGGSCPVGLESTIYDPETAQILRPGAVSEESLLHAGAQVDTHTHTEHLVPSEPRERAEKSLAPGLARRHYAPRGVLRLDVTTPLPGEVLLGFGPVEGTENLSPTADLAEAARNLFRLLHKYDAPEARLAVAPIPSHGLGRAIQDRLRRAAAPEEPEDKETP